VGWFGFDCFVEFVHFGPFSSAASCFNLLLDGRSIRREIVVCCASSRGGARSFTTITR
jgi:hypothetical protein